MTGPLQKFLAALASLLSLFLLVIYAAAQSKPGSLGGSIRDAEDRPVAGAKVWLDDQVEGRTQSATTDARGQYVFRDLPGSTYMLRVQKASYRDATQGPIALKQGETLSINLQLVAEQAGPSNPAKGAAQSMDYSDEPNFTVAGVSDPSDVGGHGSNVTLPTKEALAKDTASLAENSADPLANGETTPAAVSLPKIAADDFAGNWSTGRTLVQSGRYEDAIPYLERALQLKPDAYDADYWLAMAYLRTGDLRHAENLAKSAPPDRQTAELHALMAEIRETEGQPVEAVKEYERAAEMSPTEAHLFAWGAELLLHHAYQPAAEVFAKAHRQYPNSIRVLVGMGAAAYAQDLHDQAAHWLLEAISIDPSDPRPYEFLGKVQEVAKSEPPEWADAFHRYATLQLANAKAHYYYAVALEKLRRGEADFTSRETQLNQALALDPQFGDAHLHLGLLQAEKHDYAKAVSSLEKAVKYTPLPDEAHLRLAQVYREMGAADKARAESQLYAEVSEKKKQQLERERRELGQFVFTIEGEAGKAQQTKP